MKKNSTLTTTTTTTTIAGLTPLEAASKVSVADAARLSGIHPDTFKKNFPHLIRRIGKRRLGVTLYDAIVLPPPNTG